MVSVPAMMDMRTARRAPILIIGGHESVMEFARCAEDGFVSFRMDLPVADKNRKLELPRSMSEMLNYIVRAYRSDCGTAQCFPLFFSICMERSGTATDIASVGADPSSSFLDTTYGIVSVIEEILEDTDWDSSSSPHFNALRSDTGARACALVATGNGGNEAVHAEIRSSWWQVYNDTADRLHRQAACHGPFSVHVPFRINVIN